LGDKCHLLCHVDDSVATYDGLCFPQLGLSTWERKGYWPILGFEPYVFHLERKITTTD
jgi:hypothetical protein